MTIHRQRYVLALLWWVWGGALILIQILLSYQTAIFGADASPVWQWFLPNVVPTLGLVSAVAVFDQSNNAIARRNHLFAVAVIASAIYLLALTLAVLSVLFVADPLATLHKSSLWLGPVQGLTASSTGVFFSKEQRT